MTEPTYSNEDRALERALDRLAEMDRARPAPGFERRVAEITSAQLRAGDGAEQERTLRLGDVVVAARAQRPAWWTSSSLRIAAAVLIVAGLGGLWFVSRGPAGGGANSPGPGGDTMLAKLDASELEFALDAADLLSDSLGAEIDVLAADTNLVDEHLQQSPTPDSFGLEGGAT